VQVPPESSVTVAFDTVQIDVVWELKLTGRFEVADALTGKGAVPKTWVESVPNVIDWLSGFTVKLWLTDGAAE
jgi:hypothetical protein